MFDKMVKTLIRFSFVFKNKIVCTIVFEQGNGNDVLSV